MEGVCANCGQRLDGNRQHRRKPVCISCWRVLSVGFPEEMINRKAFPKAGSTWVVGAAVVLAVVVIVAVALTSNPHREPVRTEAVHSRETVRQTSPPAPPPVKPAPKTDPALAAIYVARQAVTKALVSPGSAKFPLVEDADEYGVAKEAENRYRISSWVDSTNRFNANIRSSWVCVVEHIPGSTTSVVRRMQIDGQDIIGGTAE